MHRHLHIYPSPITFENRIKREVEAIAELEINVIILGTYETGLTKTEWLSDKIQIRRLNRRFDHTLLTRVLFTLIFYLRCLIEIIKIRPQIVNLHSLSTLPLAPFCRLCGARVIYDAHELETETKQLKGLRKVISKRVEATFIGFAFAYIFVSRSIQKYYEDLYNLQNTEVIRNLPLYKKIQPQDKFRALFDIDADKKIFLYQGALVEGRGVREIIAAFADKPKMALVIMGFGALADEITTEIDKFPNIYFCPAVSPHELLNYTASADFGILSTDTSCLNHLYCLPNKLFEYIMAGLPILASDLVEVGIILDKYDCGIVVENLNKNTLDEAIETLLEKQYDRNAIFKVAHKLQWEEDKKVLQNFYKTRILA